MCRLYTVEEMNVAMDVMSLHLRMSMRTRDLERSATDQSTPWKNNYNHEENAWGFSENCHLVQVFHVYPQPYEMHTIYKGAHRGTWSQDRSCPIAAKMESGSMGISIQVSRTQRLAREYELRDFKQTRLEQAVGEHLPKRQDHEERQRGLLGKA